jgi:hypothetical protein
MVTLSWDSIRTRYGVDVPVWMKREPRLACGVVDPHGVFWLAPGEGVEGVREDRLVEILRALGEPELLYLGPGPDAEPPHGPLVLRPLAGPGSPSA